LLQPPSPPQGVNTLTQLLHGKGFLWHPNTVRRAVNQGVQSGELRAGGPHNSPTYSVP
jgi:hypothetical protein